MSSCNEMQNITLKIIFIKKKKIQQMKNKIRYIMKSKSKYTNIYIYINRIHLLLRKLSFILNSHIILQLLSAILSRENG